jgi:class 3 adenylate cyclase
MKRSTLAAWSMCALALALLTAAAPLLIATWQVSLPAGVGLRGTQLVVAPVYAVLGAVIVTQVRRNALGYVFLVAGLFSAADFWIEETAYAAETWSAFAVVAPWAGVTHAVLGFLIALGLIPCLIALFPSGQFATAGDRRAVLGGGLSLLVIVIALIIGPERPPAPFSSYANPAYRADLQPYAQLMGAIGTGGFVIALAVVVISSVRRFRRSVGVERQQVKWFAYAGALLAAVVGAIVVMLQVAYTNVGQASLDAPSAEVRWVAALAIGPFIFLPLAVTLAILRYRLYDVDILINRTVLYALVTTILIGIFALFSAAAQRTAEWLSGQRSDLVPIATAILVALAFGPMRRRIQPLVDGLLPARAMLALLMTDIVGSTERVVQLGDDRWRSVLEGYRAAVRHDLSRFGGQEIDTAGDGFFATFGRPTAAVECALALRDSLRKLDLDSRFGLHAGECELRGERVSGLSVIVTARIMAKAKANELVTSSALRELVRSEFTFSDRGSEPLKGIPGEWNLSMIGAPLRA